MSFLNSSHVHATASPDPAKPAQVITIPSDPELAQPPAKPSVNYLARAQWLRAAVLGANDGLVSVASLMIGVGAVNQSAKAMLVSGLAGLVAGACSMAIGEFVSVYAQYDIEVTQMRRDSCSDDDEEAAAAASTKDKEERLPNPLLAAVASALAFAMGALLPLLAGGFINSWGLRVGAVCAASSLGLAGFGAAGAFLGGANVGRSGIRVLIGGWLAMLVTYGVLRLFGLAFNMQVSSA
ncbi:vacuolar iron transporter homolog 2-like [Typha latifolia]|uniref:vacuolar iron transporter homolog 2-like n=1 Tax=Typha latifolia TaxID=4733 RepID=UPI003C2B2E68